MFKKLNFISEFQSPDCYQFCDICLKHSENLAISTVKLVFKIGNQFDFVSETGPNNQLT